MQLNYTIFGGCFLYFGVINRVGYARKTLILLHFLRFAHGYGFNYGVDNICVELNFDEKYKYNGHLIADDGGNDFYGDNVDPFDTVKFYMYSSIPDELINQYNKCTITFGFDENFGYNDDNTYSYISSMDECKYTYEITVSK